MAKIEVKYRVLFMESERGWGQDYWYGYYDTEKAAKKAIHECNSKNTAPTAPDTYIVAFDDIDIVPASVVPKGK